jgi:OmpA-OmpF porin, OOP family
MSLKKDRNAHILLEGHADNEGAELFNMTLSVQRAQSVKNYFVKGGIEPERISIKGYGETMPVSSNNTKEGKQTNRRVQIIIVK